MKFSMRRGVVEGERNLPYAPGDLCRIVGDVKSYPKFLPWLKSLKVRNETPLPDGGWEGVADCVVGKGAISERFSTRVRSAPGEGKVDVALISGPFRALESRWRFEDDGKGGAQVTFWMTYEFNNPVLQSLVTANRKMASERIMKAFLDEAKRRLGAGSTGARA